MFFNVCEYFLCHFIYLYSSRFGYAKPKITDILWIQLICLPYKLLNYIYWNLRWFWKFSLLKHEYGDEEKLYLIKKYLQCSTAKWNCIPDDEKEGYLKEELWIKKNYEVSNT